MQFIHARQPKNIQDLEEFCQEGWTALPQEKIKSSIHNYHKKLQALVDARGAILRTKNLDSSVMKMKQERTNRYRYISILNITLYVYEFDTRHYSRSMY